MSEEFSIPSAPNFTKYLKENFGDDISLGEFSDVITSSGVTIETKNNLRRVGPHSFEVPILLNGEEIGRLKRYVGVYGGLTCIEYSGVLPCYYNPATKDHTVVLYNSEYVLWDSLEEKVAERMDEHPIPFP